MSSIICGMSWTRSDRPEPSILSSNATHVGLNPQAEVWIDVQEFLRLTGPNATLEQQTRGPEPLRRRFLARFVWRLGAAGTRAPGRALRETLTRLLTHYQNNGMLEQALEMARRLVASDPLQEDATRALMRLHDRAGGATAP